MFSYTMETSFKSKRGLIRNKDSRFPQLTRPSHELDLSITLSPGEVQRLLDAQNNVTFGNTTVQESPSFLGSSSFMVQDKTVNDLTEISAKEKLDMLFPQFLEVLQSRTNDSEVFDTIQDLIQTCSAILDEVVKNGKRFNDKYKLGGNEWLEEEQNTWKLLYALYKDRLLVQNDATMECDLPPQGVSEKEVVNQLYSNNANVREYQLIVDWLEACVIKQDSMQVGHSTDSTVGWENTLFQLQNPNDIVFGSKHEIVQSLDPDAPVREKKPLHPLDEEDNLRLSKCIFNEIRQGKIEEAMALCKYCGQTWRAAILEGWRLYEDPNYESSHVREKIPIEGNPRRDVWKRCAWSMANSPKFDEYTRAIAGVFCGHLESLLALLKDSWEDLLWAYLKVQIDIRVESEIRSCCMRNYHEMPDAYWNGKMTLEQIFDELAVHKNVNVKKAAESKMHTIQKYLILDNMPELLQEMHMWVEKEKLSAHMLRFLSHIVLFLRQIGKIDKDDVADKVLKAYVECLIEIGEARLVAFYTAALPNKMQVFLYSKFLETVKTTPARRLALEEALAAGLDVENITAYTVENIRNRQVDYIEDKQLVGEMSEMDEEKISALEWLTFYPEQKGDLLWQANAMIRCFLAENKVECVRSAFEMIPADSLGQIIAIYGDKDNLPCREECSIKEYLSYKIYLSALDAFNDWTRLYHNQPKEPQLAKSDAKFTERIASEHKEQAYRAELDRWKINLEEQSKITRDALFNVLLFPDKGWLVDPDTPKDPADIEESEWENRQVQLERLRTLCIPEIVLLLHKVMHLSGDRKGCIKLADEIASEARQLYKVYSKHKLAELLTKLAESSLALMNDKLDPWGYTVVN